MDAPRRSLAAQHSPGRVKRRPHSPYIPHQGNGIASATYKITRQDFYRGGFNGGVHRLNKMRPSLGFNDSQSALSQSGQ